jgi:hypothetical protein
MGVVLLIFALWVVLSLSVLVILYCAGRADERTERQLEEVGLYGARNTTPATVLRNAVARDEAPIGLDGYGGLLLKRLAIQTCRVFGVEASAIFLHDPRRDELALIAVHRLDDDLVGRRAAATGRVRDAALMGARAWVPATELWPIQHLLPPGADALIAGIEGGGSRGVLVAAGRGPFSERDLELVGHVADLAGAGLGDAGLRAGLDAALEGGVRALEAAIERADLRAARTARDVVRLATTLGRLLGLDAPALVELQLAARLREVGELSGEDAHEDPIADETPMLPVEVATRSADVLARVPGLEVVALIVRHEHERWDGRGRPEGLIGERIPLAGRILAVAAAFTELTGPGRSTDFDALAVLTVASGSRFDAVVVETLAGLALPPSGRTAPAPRPEWAAADLELVAP